MRYYYEPVKKHDNIIFYSCLYHCRHPLFDLCTLYQRDGVGLAIVQMQYNPITKTLSWGPVMPQNLSNDIYEHPKFAEVFDELAGPADDNGCYPTYGVRKIMWKLRMKPLKKAEWEQKLQGL